MRVFPERCGSRANSYRRASTATVMYVFIVCALFRQAAFAAETNSAARQLGPGIYEIGLVRVDAIKRQLTLPAQVNMLEGPIEYVLVSAIGKLHESIFKTDAQPVHIHTAALLLLK